jgi:hypothetical protein
MALPLFVCFLIFLGIIVWRRHKTYAARKFGEALKRTADLSHTAAQHFARAGIAAHQAGQALERLHEAWLATYPRKENDG